jgi:hypothetical protein
MFVAEDDAPGTAKKQLRQANFASYSPHGYSEVTVVTSSSGQREEWLQGDERRPLFFGMPTLPAACSADLQEQAPALAISS